MIVFTHDCDELSYYGVLVYNQLMDIKRFPFKEHIIFLLLMVVFRVDDDYENAAVTCVLQNEDNNRERAVAIHILPGYTDPVW